MHSTVKALDQAAGRGGGALAAWVVGCTQPPAPLLTFTVHLSQPGHLSQGSPEKQNPWDMHVRSTYTRTYVRMCYEYIPLALFLRRTLTHAQTHTHTQSIYYKELAHAFQEAKSHHPQGKPGKLVVSLLNSSLSPTTPEPGAATGSASAQGQEKTSVPAHTRAETASPLLSCLLSGAAAAACRGPSPPGGASAWLCSGSKAHLTKQQVPR